MEYVTVSAKVPRRLKEMLDKYNIKVGPVIRKALEEEVRKRMIEEVEEDIGRLKDGLSHIPDEEIVRLIREDREAK